MKTRKRAVFFMAMTALVLICTCFAGCENGSKNEESQSQQEQEVKKEIPIVNLKTIILGNFSDAETTAFKRLFPNSEFSSSVAQVDESYKVVICDIDDIPEKIAKDAYYVLYTVNKSAFDNIMQVHEAEYEAGLWTEEAIEEMREYVNKWPYLFYACNMTTGAEFTSYYAEGNEETEKMQLAFGGEPLTPATNETSENEEEEDYIGEDFIVEGMNEQEKLNFKFESLAKWINSMEAEYSVETETRTILQKSLARAAEAKASSYNLNNFTNMIGGNTVNVLWTKTYSPNLKNPGAGYDQTCRYEISYSYLPILLSSSAGTPGLYYFVTAAFTIDNSKMWFGASDKYTGIRTVGVYFKNFEITFTPSVTGDGATAVKIGGSEFDYVQPRSTSTGSTKYESGYQFTFGADLKVKGGYESKDTNKSGGAEVGFKWGATWNNKKLFDIQNVQINNITSVSNGIAGWKVFIPENQEGEEPYLQPHARFRAHNQYDIGCPECRNMCQTYYCSWLWYIPFNDAKAYKKDANNKIEIDNDGIPVIDISKLPKLTATIAVKGFHGTQYKYNAAGRDSHEEKWYSYYTFPRSFPVTNNLDVSKLVYITK